MKNKLLSIVFMAPLVAIVGYMFYNIIRLAGWWNFIKSVLSMLGIFVATTTFMYGIYLWKEGGEKK